MNDKKKIDYTGLKEIKPKSVAELMKTHKFEPKIERYTGRGASHDDGYWILLQDWSQCSLKCGGGKRTQQWMCVPPRKHGKPCVGNAVREKICHMKACPKVEKNTVGLKADDSSHITLKPIYKAMPFSKRPQQYVKCMVKENDVLYKTTEYDPERLKSIKVPGRIVMNTNTISVYKDDSYSNILFSFNLQETTFSKADKEHCCFFLTSHNRQEELCGFNNNCGTVDNPIWVSKWGFDFEYFQRRCHEDLEETPKKKLKGKNQTNARGGPGGGGLPMSGAAADVVEGRRDLIQKKVDDNTQQKMEDKVDKTQKLTLTALRREINLEDMIKKEEKQKGQEETDALMSQMKQEKKKKKLLESALITREQNYGKVRQNKDTEKKINSIKADAKVDIKFKRQNLKKNIAEIRNKFRRKHRQIQQQIQAVRSEMASDIMDANKHGDMNNCRAANNDLAKINSYCDKGFSASYRKNASCKEPSNFCYACCDNEYGNMFIAQRDDCQTMCDDLEKSEMAKGDWVWTNTNEAPVKTE